MVSYEIVASPQHFLTEATPIATNLPQSFFARPAEQVAPELIGCLLVKRQADGELLWKWSGVRAKGDMPYTLQQIRFCYAVSELKKVGLAGLREVAERLDIKPKSLRNNLDEWLKRGYLNVANYEAIRS